MRLAASMEVNITGASKMYAHHIITQEPPVASPVYPVIRNVSIDKTGRTWGGCNFGLPVAADAESGGEGAVPQGRAVWAQPGRSLESFVKRPRMFLKNFTAVISTRW